MSEPILETPRARSLNSMNLVNYETTGMAQAFEAVSKEAQRVGVEIAGTEIVGLVPEAALDRQAEYFSRLENFDTDTVIEHRIKKRASLSHNSEQQTANGKQQELPD